MILDLNLDEAPADSGAATALPRLPMDLIEQRLAFSAWPQARVHPSWLQALSLASGVPASPAWGAGHGPAARAVADALLIEAGAAPASAAPRIPIDRVPAWALQPPDRLQRQLSTAGALNLLPELRAVVRGEAIRHWDAVLGPDVRRNTLRWCVQNLKVDAPPHARSLRSQAQAAARTPDGWQAFCQAMALAALAELGEAVQLRMRLLWPHAQRHVAALALEPAATRWLHTCLKVADVMLADLETPDELTRPPVAKPVAAASATSAASAPLATWAAPQRAPVTAGLPS